MKRVAVTHPLEGQILKGENGNRTDHAGNPDKPSMSGPVNITRHLFAFCGRAFDQYSPLPNRKRVLRLAASVFTPMRQILTEAGIQRKDGNVGQVPFR
ncbi:hypothetical protein [Ruegeria jejuensis]|uniref:hypothetical protein n=1 Tax=Ruegeria jejuensis TaxID=3233338 RepID=UPI00355B4561